MEKVKKNDMRISTRMQEVFNMLFRLMGISSILALILIQVIGINMIRFYNNEYEVSKKQMSIRKDVQTLNKRILYALASADDEVTKAQQEDIADRFVTIQEDIDFINSRMGSMDTGSMNKAYTDYQAATNAFMDLVAAGQSKEALDYYNSNYNDASEAMADALEAIGSASDEKAAFKYMESIVIQIVASLILVVFGVVAFRRSVKSSRRLSLSITEPLDDLAGAAEEIARGNVHIHVGYEGRDEIGQLADSLREAMGFLADYIDDIKTTMAAMAEGDFTRKLEHEFIGDFRSIQDSIEECSEKISVSMREIDSVSGRVSGGADQIADAGQSLAKGATDQADIVEDLSAKISDISQKISDNAENATAISVEVKGMTDGIIQSNQRMQNVVSAMEAISQTSHEISKIIGTINDISEQTNLLALNASIEAARAGETGKGFAVVANEVGALANQSSEAARTTAQYIQGALQAVADGMEIANDTAKELNTVVENAGFISQKVDDIAKASEQQAVSVQQINDGINHISQMVDSNAATAEESSASSMELTGQAQSLKALLEKFVIEP